MVEGMGCLDRAWIPRECGCFMSIWLTAQERERAALRGGVCPIPTRLARHKALDQRAAL